ncbi:D-aminoacyl-tRNA deacylase [Victivallis sp. Marseille-Q1083]|uniref:D-aminoacyl-tRNA deacylase n=1 Tax=Victivallis sp. Marseille-Q1083 TaxID=2717288 RepID=UPI001588675A|nr:D-aminoacyl-tRNA deacylase [Victivallis sp. Marseille-Q1083]
MRALVQRVSSGAVCVGTEQLGAIGKGLVILLGVTHADTAADVDFLAEKCVNLRIFADEAGKMNRSLADLGGAALIVSQFTLYADCSHGRRPGFAEAAPPEQAERLYDLFVDRVKRSGIGVATGRFGAEMQLEIHNDGPVTLLVESRK